MTQQADDFLRNIRQYITGWKAAELPEQKLNLASQVAITFELLDKSIHDDADYPTEWDPRVQPRRIYGGTVRGRQATYILPPRILAPCSHQHHKWLDGDADKTACSICHTIRIVEGEESARAETEDGRVPHATDLP